MKKVFYFLGLFLLIYSCSVKKPPVFIKLDDVKVISFQADTIQLQANAHFQNPNDVGGKILIPTKRIFENNKNGILGGLIASILKNKVKVQFKGNLKYAVFGFTKEFLVDKTQEMKINF